MEGISGDQSGQFLDELGVGVGVLDCLQIQEQEHGDQARVGAHGGDQVEYLVFGVLPTKGQAFYFFDYAPRTVCGGELAKARNQ